MALQLMQATSTESEGSDDLLVFLTAMQVDLKNVDKVYQGVMKAELDKEELLEFEAADIRSLLEGKLENLYIARLIKALRKLPESRAHKQDQQKPVVVLSSEEDTALNEVAKKSQQFKENMQRITQTISELEVSSKANEDTINDAFDQVIKVANQRRATLLQQVQALKQEKNDKLVQQLSSIKEYDEKLAAVYDDAQKLIQDTSVDALKRRTKILSSTGNTLKVAEELGAFTLSATSKIKTVLDTKSIIAELTTLGDVIDVDLPSAPIITVQSVDAFSVVLKIRNEDTEADIVAHRLQYAETNGVEDAKLADDEKVKWESVEISNGGKEIEYTLQGLWAETKYAVMCASKSVVGYGLVSELCGFETKHGWKFDVVTDGCQDWIEQDGKMFRMKQGGYANASSSQGYSTGVHEFKIKIKNNASDGAFTIKDAIFVEKQWTNKYEGTQYYLYYSGTIYTGNDSSLGSIKRWSVDDIVTMILDCNKWTVTYTIGDSSKTVGIEKNKTYYPCVSQRKKDYDFHIVD